MCFTDDDQEMWENDPHEYIRMKFGEFIWKNDLEYWRGLNDDYLM